MESLHVSQCFLWLLAVSHSLSQYHGVAACLSLSPMVPAFLTVSYGFWLSLTVSLSSMELLAFSHCLLWFLAVSHFLSGPMELLHVSHCLQLLRAVSHCLS